MVSSFSSATGRELAGMHGRSKVTSIHDLRSARRRCDELNERLDDSRLGMAPSDPVVRVRPVAEYTIGTTVSHSALNRRGAVRSFCGSERLIETVSRGMDVITRNVAGWTTVFQMVRMQHESFN